MLFLFIIKEPSQDSNNVKWPLCVLELYLSCSTIVRIIFTEFSIHIVLFFLLGFFFFFSLIAEELPMFVKQSDYFEGAKHVYLPHNWDICQYKVSPNQCTPLHHVCFKEWIYLVDNNMLSFSSNSDCQGKCCIQIVSSTNGENGVADDLEGSGRINIFFYFIFI